MLMKEYRICMPLTVEEVSVCLSHAKENAHTHHPASESMKLTGKGAFLKHGDAFKAYKLNRAVGKISNRAQSLY